MKCPYCGSENIRTGIKWGKAAEAGSVGLDYKAGIFLVGNAAVYSDLCMDCGTIVRSYVKDSTDKNWLCDEQ